MKRIRTKICGITRLEDAQVAARCGADALGFVFYEPSPRSVDVQVAADIIQSLPAFVTSVALFVDADPEFVRDVIRLTRCDLLQFHGGEDPDFCQQFDRPYIKALRMQANTDVRTALNDYRQARGLLLDAYHPSAPGGTGERFDWGLFPAQEERDVAESNGTALLLAGGLNPDNVENAILTTQPYAVDVSGGVEQAKGVKDAEKIQRFIQGVQRASQS